MRPSSARQVTPESKAKRVGSKKFNTFDTTMDELKIIFWIVIGLVYLFARRKKAQPARTERPAEANEEYDAPEPAKPATFEELLREIQGMKKQETPPQPEPSPRFGDRPPSRREMEQETFEDDAVEERKQLEDTKYDYRNNDKIYEVYDDAKKQAFLRPSLEETVKLEDTIVRFQQFKGYTASVRRNLAEEFFKELKEPQGFRKAFIMSEILKKRF